MEENNLNEPQYRKPETLKAIEILLGIEQKRSEKKGEQEEESELVAKAKELKAKLDALLKENEK